MANQRAMAKNAGSIDKTRFIRLSKRLLVEARCAFYQPNGEQAFRCLLGQADSIYGGPPKNATLPSSR